MVVDFNNELVFTKSNLGYYNVDLIDENIRKYLAFKKEIIVSEEFEKIFNSVMFQSMFKDNTTNDVDNLLSLYNGLARTGVLDKRIFKELTKKEFMNSLQAIGYRFKRTTKYVNGSIVNVIRIEKDELYE